MRVRMQRGKRIDNNEWAFGNVICDTIRNRVLILEIPPRFDDNGYHLPAVKVDPETVGDWTGLMEKNGIKIHEGDIIEINRPCVYMRGLVVFMNGGFYFEYRIPERDGQRGYLDFHSIVLGEYKINIIGNRWDNPEML